ncbi:DUF3078 domain-containing protein [bacterium]|nr:DUF3078 domain-containing protein [bacterium]
MKHTLLLILCFMLISTASALWAQTVQETAPVDTPAVRTTPESAAAETSVSPLPDKSQESASSVQVPKEPANSNYGWKPEIIGRLNLAQNAFDNWSQGGEDSLSWQVTLHGKCANDQANYNWSNAGKLAFGQIKAGAGEMKKSVDEINLESVFNYKLKIPINPFLAVKGETQFTTGYAYTNNAKLAVSNFMDPVYLTESLGAGYSQGKFLRTRLGLAAKQTITNQYPHPYADNPNTPAIEKIKYEYGLESVTDLSLKFSDILTFTSKLEIFSNLKATDQIDVRWDNLFTASLSKYLNVAFNIQWFYDKDISPLRQIRKTLTLGLIYTFI